MKRMLRCCGLLLAFLPFMASADPVYFNAVANGSIRPDAAWLSTFTGNPQGAPGSPVPFELTLGAKIDTDRSGFFQGASYAGQSGPVNATLTIGGETFEFKDTYEFMTINSTGTLSVHFKFLQGPVFFTTSIYFENSAGAFEGGPLSLRDIDTGGAISASYWFRAFPSEASIIEISGPLDSASLSVTSAIPEPNTAGMLAGGLVLLLLVSRRARYRPVQ